MRSDFPEKGSEILTTRAQTQDVGARLGRALESGDVVILDGPLGAGKTTLTQGIAEGMGVQGRVTSPTFVLAREHRSPHSGPNLVHVDAYRLLDDFGAGSGDPIGDLDALDLDTELADAVIVAEWGGGLVEQLSDDFLLVRIDRESARADDAPLDEDGPRVISWEWYSR